MTSDDLIEMIERKLKDYGLRKVIPDDDLLGEAYQAFHRSQELREKFEEMEDEFEESEIEVPEELEKTSPRDPQKARLICAGTMRSRSCSTKRSSITCGRRSKRQKRNPATSRMPTKTKETRREPAPTHMAAASTRAPALGGVALPTLQKPPPRGDSRIDHQQSRPAADQMTNIDLWPIRALIAPNGARAIVASDAATTLWGY